MVDVEMISFSTYLVFLFRSKVFFLFVFIYFVYLFETIGMRTLKVDGIFKSGEKRNVISLGLELNKTFFF